MAISYVESLVLTLNDLYADLDSESDEASRATIQMCIDMTEAKIARIRKGN